jgi:hypothetical protein
MNTDGDFRSPEGISVIFLWRFCSPSPPLTQSATWATFLALLFLVCFSLRFSLTLLGLALDHDPPSSAFRVARIAGMLHPTQLVFEIGSCYLPRLSSNPYPPLPSKCEPPCQALYSTLFLKTLSSWQITIYEKFYPKAYMIRKNQFQIALCITGTDMKTRSWSLVACGLLQQRCSRIHTYFLKVRKLSFVVYLKTCHLLERSCLRYLGISSVLFKKSLVEAVCSGSCL